MAASESDSSEALSLGPHEFVTKLANALAGPSGSSQISSGGPASQNRADLVTFLGFLGGTVVQPGGKAFQLFYLEPSQRTWMLVEEDGIRYTTKIKDDAAPTGQRDMIWVSVDAAVGKGSGPQSDEAMFLTGEFTRAGHLDAAPAGGTMPATTGVFCPGACGANSR